jgi:hypothetical protein
MSLDTALFLVERDRVNHHVSGANAKTVMEHGDRVLVQRGDDIYTTWHSKPLPAVVPYMTRRLTYTREYDSAQGKYVHPSGDGKINLGYDFGTAGNYPAEEWRNVRNQKASFNDLDGKLFVIGSSTQYEKDDLVRITHEGGDLEAWYSLTDATWMQFQEHYDDNGRPQANITPVEGTKPSVDDGAILKFEFFKPSTHPFDTIAEDDLLLVWEDNQSKHVTAGTFKGLFTTYTLEQTTSPYIDHIEISGTEIYWYIDCPGALNVTTEFERSDGFYRFDDWGGPHDSYNPFGKMVTSDSEPLSWLQMTAIVTYPDGSILRDSHRVTLAWGTT